MFPSSSRLSTLRNLMSGSPEPVELGTSRAVGPNGSVSRLQGFETVRGDVMDSVKNVRLNHLMNLEAVDRLEQTRATGLPDEPIATSLPDFGWLA